MPSKRLFETHAEHVAVVVAEQAAELLVRHQNRPEAAVADLEHGDAGRRAVEREAKERVAQLEGLAGRGILGDDAQM